MLDPASKAEPMGNGSMIMKIETINRGGTMCFIVVEQLSYIPHRLWCCTFKATFFLSTIGFEVLHFCSLTVERSYEWFLPHASDINNWRSKDHWTQVFSSRPIRIWKNCKFLLCQCHNSSYLYLKTFFFCKE